MFLVPTSRSPNPRTLREHQGDPGRFNAYARVVCDVAGKLTLIISRSIHSSPSSGRYCDGQEQGSVVTSPHSGRRFVIVHTFLCAFVDVESNRCPSRYEGHHARDKQDRGDLRIEEAWPTFQCCYNSRSGRAIRSRGARLQGPILLLHQNDEMIQALALLRLINDTMRYDAGTDPSQPLGLKRRSGHSIDADVPGKGRESGLHQARRQGQPWV